VKAMFNDARSNEIRSHEAFVSMAKKLCCFTFGPVCDFSNANRHVKVVIESEKGKC